MMPLHIPTGLQNCGQKIIISIGWYLFYSSRQTEKKGSLARLFLGNTGQTTDPWVFMKMSQNLTKNREEILLFLDRTPEIIKLIAKLKKRYGMEVPQPLASLILLIIHPTSS